MQTRTAKVGVDHERGVTALRANVGKVHQGRRLALASTTGNDGDRVVLGVLAVELDVRSQNPVGLGVGSRSPLSVE